MGVVGPPDRTDPAGRTGVAVPSGRTDSAGRVDRAAVVAAGQAWPA